MAREAIPEELNAIRDFARLAREVAKTGKRHVLKENGEDLVVISPARRRRRTGKAMTAAVREAVLASVGSWEGLVDDEQLKRDLDGARSDNRPPINL